LIPVQIGGKTFNLIVDSGSSDLWVYSRLLPSAQQVGHTLYDAPNSKLQKSSYFAITYGDGSNVAGKVFVDTVAIGGVTAAKQAVEAPTGVSASFLQHPDADGLIGLAMSNLNTVRPKQALTFFDNVRSQLAAPLWAITLKHNATGSMDLGFIDKSRYVGSLNYINVVGGNSSFWQFNIKAFSVNGTSFQTAPFTAIVDTGTSLALLPDAVLRSYYSKIQGAQLNSNAGGWTFPCSSTIPSMGLWINGVKYGIPAKTLNWGFIGQDANGEYICLGAVQSSARMGFSILGDVFLKSVYVVFDMKNPARPRIGLGKQPLY